ELAVANTAVMEPVALEQLVIEGPTGDVGARAAGRGRHEPDLLEAFLDTPTREHGCPVQRLDQHLRSVIGEQGNGVGPHRRVFAVPLDVSLVKASTVLVLWAPLVDARPSFELLEPHQIEHECGAHDARRIPADRVERLAELT